MSPKTTQENNSDVVIYRLDSIDEKLIDLKQMVDHNFVSKDTYKVEVGSLKDDVKYLKNLVYGAVGTFIALAIAAATAGKLLK